MSPATLPPTGPDAPPLVELKVPSHVAVDVYEYDDPDYPKNRQRMRFKVRHSWTGHRPATLAEAHALAARLRCEPHRTIDRWTFQEVCVPGVHCEVVLTY